MEEAYNLNTKIQNEFSKVTIEKVQESRMLMY